MSERRRLPVLLPVALVMLIGLSVRAASAQEAAPAAVTPPVDLRPMWQDGQTSKYKTITRRATTAQVRGGKPRTSVMDVTAVVTWQVVDANAGGGGRCTMTVDDLKVELTGPDGKKQSATRDRADADLKSIQELVRAMIGKPVTVTVDSAGRITGATGWQAIKNAAGEAGKNLTETDFRESAAELAPLPGGPASADTGVTWKEKFDWDHEMGRIHLASDYKVTGIESVVGIGLVTVDRTSKVTFTIDRDKLPDQGPQVAMKMLDGAEKASLMYDLSRHEVVGGDMQRALVFQIDVELEGRQIQQLVKQQLRTQVLRVEEGE